MNSMEFNKIAGAAIGALLVFLLLNLFSGLIYGTEGGEHATGDEVVLAYAVPAESGATAKKPEVIDLFALLENADPEDGKKVARACAACHSFKEGEVKIGPPLYDVVGRKIASETEFTYSDAMKAEAAKDTVWTPEHLFHFIDDPQKVVPGTLMTFAGIKDPADRANLIAYLNTLGGTPVELTEGLKPLAPAEGEKAEGEAGKDTAAAEGEGATATDATDAGATAPAEGAAADEAAATPEAEETEETEAPAKEDAAPAKSGEASGEKAAEPAEADTADKAAAPATNATTGEETAPAEAEEATGEKGTVPAKAAEADKESATEAPAAEGKSTKVAKLDGDAAAGEKVFRRCKICHSLAPGENKIGPSLHGVIGRDIGSEEGYQYSDAMLAEEGVWTIEKLEAYLKDPKAAIPGNKMPFPGLPKKEDRVNVLTYIQQASK